ncbi:MAG: UbiA prenyltransferase family protein [Candidatus Beckwithbacteria bacterium]|nr:UbiA prenyltransferase family protein [Candidatus Beckwithbacteria bacterium]
MVEYGYLLLKEARPRQILKNLALFTGLIFSGWLFIAEKFWIVAMSFVVFSILTGSIYIFNDIIDIKADKNHPFKKFRPLASGKLPIPIALFFSLAGILISLTLGWSLSYFLFLIMIGYIGLQLLYTLSFKHKPILDVMTIAMGFVIRVYGGALVISAHLNVWLLLCIISFSLFLAIGKRRSELTLLQGQSASRLVLGRYPEKLLDLYTAMFANTTWLTYALFTFMFPAFEFKGRVLTLLSTLPHTFRSEKWLMATIPLVIYGVMRYLQLIYERNEGESPEKILTSDKGMLITVVIWGLMTIGILYGLG